MKWIIRIAILLILLVAGTFVFAAFKLNDIASALKPKILETVKAATGGEFNFEDLSVHAFPSPHLELQKISLTLPQGVKANVESISTSIKLRSILSGNLEVSSISLKNGSGSYALKGLPNPITFDDLSLSTSAKLSPSGAIIDSLSANTKIQKKIPVTLKGSDIDFNLSTKNLNLGGVNLSLPLGDVKIKGSASPSTSDLSFNGEKLSVKEMLIAAAVFFEAASHIPLDGEVSFDGSANGLPPAVVSNIRSSLSYNGLPISLSSKPAFKGNVLTVGELDFSAAQGNLKGDASVDISNLSLVTSLKGGGFELSELVKLGKSPVPIVGKVSSVTIQGFGANSAMTSFAGSGNIGAQSITIPGVNLFGSVVDSIRAIPGLAEILLQGLSPTAQAAITSGATELSSGVVSFSGKGGSILLNQIEGKSTLFSITGNGVVEPLSQSGKLALNMLLSEELSANLATKLKGGTGFMENGKIKIPLEVHFSPGGAKVMPKVDGLLKGAALEAGKQILNKALSGDSKGAKELLGGILGF